MALKPQQTTMKKGNFRFIKTESGKIFLQIDKNNQIHDCSRFGRLFDRLHGRPVDHPSVMAIIEDEFNSCEEFTVVNDVIQ